MKHTSHNLYSLERMAAQYSEKVFFNGFDEIYLSALSAGATATIGTTVNLQPERFIAVRDAFRRGDFILARALQQKINDAVAFMVECGIFQSAKYLAGRHLTDLGPVRALFTPLTPAQKKALDALDDTIRENLAMAKDSDAFSARSTLSDKAALRTVADLIESTSTNPDTTALAVAIVGIYGELVAFGAHHTCPPLSRLLAQRKVYTAFMLRRSTRLVSEEVQRGSLTLGVLNDVQLLPIPGGMLIRLQGRVVDAIGISGLPVEQDIALAEYWEERFG